MAQKSTKKRLSKKQLAVAELLADPSFMGTITELCARCDVPRRTFYNWRDEPLFCEYVDSLIDKYTDSELASVWKSLIRACMDGNVQAMRLYFELKNKFKENIKTNAAGEDDALTKALREEAERLDADADQ